MRMLATLLRVVVQRSEGPTASLLRLRSVRESLFLLNLGKFVRLVKTKVQAVPRRRQLRCDGGEKRRKVAPRDGSEVAACSPRPCRRNSAGSKSRVPLAAISSRYLAHPALHGWRIPRYMNDRLDAGGRCA